MESKMSTVISYEDFNLLERSSLNANKSIRVYELIKIKGRFGKKRLLSETLIPIAWSLEEISVEKLTSLRKDKSGKASFVLKDKDRYFHAFIPEDLNLMSQGMRILGKEHICAMSGKECDRLDASPDPYGCAKIRAKHPRIENYPYITWGYEVFNSSNLCFIIGRCEHYCLPKPRECKSFSEIQELKRSLRELFSSGFDRISWARTLKGY